jgi:hypothetical protein
MPSYEPAMKRCSTDRKGGANWLSSEPLILTGQGKLNNPFLTPRQLWL